MADRLRVSGLQVDCVVGVYPRERDTPQPLTVDLTLEFDAEPSAVSERMRDTLDYEGVAAEVAFILRSAAFRMLETAAHVIAKVLLLPPLPGEERPRVTRAIVRLAKPGALGGIAVPSIEICREATWLELGREERPFGTVDVVHETHDAGVYRLNVAPGRSIPLHMHRRMREAEMVLSEGLEVQGKAVPPGTVHRWPAGAAHGYRNATDRVQSILCVDAPPFLEEDEILVSGDPVEVAAENAWGVPVRVT